FPEGYVDPTKLTNLPSRGPSQGPEQLGDPGRALSLWQPLIAGFCFQGNVESTQPTENQAVTKRLAM
ncbi:MAG TPA: hypothetical protein VI685_08130, partial [Candidatus Angelobacter sp.]